MPDADIESDRATDQRLINFFDLIGDVLQYAQRRDDSPGTRSA